MATGGFKLPINSGSEVGGGGGGTQEDVVRYSDWVRPEDWLPMPTNITETDQIFVGLHAVIEDSDNYCSLLFTTSDGQYQVDWGDGNITLHDSGTLAQYQYNYATVSDATLSSRGYKQVIITVTPVSGNLLTCDFQQRFVTTPAQNVSYSSGFLDCILSMPNASTGQSIIFGGYLIKHSYCEKVDVKTIGNATDISTMFNTFYSLQLVSLFDTSKVTLMRSMFAGCHSLRSVPLFNTFNVTSMESMFNTCHSLRSVPLFNTSKVTNMSQMFQLCYSLQSVPLFNTANVTNMSYTFYDCRSLQSVPLFNTSKVIFMGDLFYNCYSLTVIPAFITTTFTSEFSASNCHSLNKVLASFNRSVTLSGCQLSKDALVEIFTNLVDRTATTSANISISNNWGASALTTEDRLIATSKNWTISG